MELGLLLASIKQENPGDVPLGDFVLKLRVFFILS